MTYADGGWTRDESPQELGAGFPLPGQFEHRRGELFNSLEPIDIEENTASPATSADCFRSEFGRDRATGARVDTTD